MPPNITRNPIEPAEEDSFSDLDIADIAERNEPPTATLEDLDPVRPPIRIGYRPAPQDPLLRFTEVQSRSHAEALEALDSLARFAPVQSLWPADARERFAALDSPSQVSARTPTRNPENITSTTVIEHENKRILKLKKQRHELEGGVLNLEENIQGIMENVVYQQNHKQQLLASIGELTRQIDQLSAQVASSTPASGQGDRPLTMGEL